MLKGMLRRWMNNFSTEILRFLFIGVAALTGLAWQWLQINYPGLQIVVPGTSKEFQSLSVSLFALAQGMNIAALLTKNTYLTKIDSLRGDIKASVPSDTRVVCRGRVEDALSHIDRLLINAKFVKNTVISISDRKSLFDNYFLNVKNDLSEIVRRVVIPTAVVFASCGFHVAVCLVHLGEQEDRAWRPGSQSHGWI